MTGFVSASGETAAPGFAHPISRPRVRPAACCLTPLLLISAAWPALALPPNPTPPASAELPAVEVTERPSFSEPSGEIPTLTVLDRSAVSVSGKRDIDGVLRGQPGIGVLGASRGSPANFSLRGTSGGLGQVMLDDMPLFGPSTNLMPLAALPADAVERVETLRGPSAPRYGSQALGGVVRLFSRDSTRSGAFLHLDGGNFGTVQETVGGSLAGDMGRVTATVSRDDVFEGVSQAVPAQGNGERDGFHATQETLRFLAQPSSPLTVDGTFLHQQQQVDVDGIGPRADGGLGAVDDRQGVLHGETWLAQNTATLAVGPDWKSRLKLGYTQDRGNLFFHAFGVGVATDFTARLLLARWQNIHNLYQHTDGSSALTFQWGGEWRREEGQGRDSLRNIDFTGARSDVAGFAEIAGEAGAWNGFGGVRVDRYGDVGTHPVYYLGTAYRLMPELRLRINGGTGYRPASYNERLFPYFGNPNLKPEHGPSGDVGLDWQPLPALRLSVSGFYSRFDDLIQLSFVPSLGAFQSENIARTRIQGAEAEAVYVWRYGLSGGLAYTYTDSRNLDTNRLLPFRSEHSGRVWGQWQGTDVPATFWLEVVYRGRFWNDDANLLVQPAAARVNARVSYRMFPAMSIYLRGENLLDNRTADGFGLGIPGAAVYGGVVLDL